MQYYDCHIAMGKYANVNFSDFSYLLVILFSDLLCLNMSSSFTDIGGER